MLDTPRCFSCIALVVAVLTATTCVHASELQLETPRNPKQTQRKEFPLVGEESSFKFNYVQDGMTVNNEAVLQRQVTKAQQPFLSTLSDNGQAQFLTVLKPCGIILPHVHHSSEFYSIMFGEMTGGVAQENGALQNITIKIGVGEVFIAPRGLLHFNLNQECVPNAFFQSFDSADPGPALNVIGALAAFNAAGGDGAAAMVASNAASVTASKQMAFGLDPACLKRCGFPATGAPPDGLQKLPKVLRKLFGI